MARRAHRAGYSFFFDAKFSSDVEGVIPECEKQIELVAAADSSRPEPHATFWAEEGKRLVGISSLCLLVASPSSFPDVDFAGANKG